MNKKGIITSILLTCFLLPVYLYGQMDYWLDEPDPDREKEFNRYAHLGLTTVEWLLIIIGLILILIAKKISNDHERISTVFYYVGGFACLPLIMIIISLAQKVLEYAFFLALILGLLYFIYRDKS